MTVAEKTAVQSALMLHPDDDVAVALAPLTAGTIPGPGFPAVRSNIPRGHKFALSIVSAGAPVTKYGAPIGRALARIQPGDHVHSHNLASALSIMGQNNLVIDLDPQGNATTGLGNSNNDNEKNVYQLLIKKINLEKIIQKTSLNNLDIVGSNVNLSGLEVETANDANRAFLLKEILTKENDSYFKKYENIFIDCPQSLSLLTVM